MVAAIPVRVPARTATCELDRLQFDIGDAGSDIQPGLALHADRLQRIGILRPADQKVAAAADPDRCVGADATVIAREIAASNPAGRCIQEASAVFKTRRFPNPPSKYQMFDGEVI